MDAAFVDAILRKHPQDPSSIIQVMLDVQNELYYLPRDVLDLNLAPLDLNLLGLVVHLDAVNLQITAQQGSGNLLGNLLCAVTNLLSGFNPNVAGQLATLLNQVAAILTAL